MSRMWYVSPQCGLCLHNMVCVTTAWSMSPHCHLCHRNVASVTTMWSMSPQHILCDQMWSCQHCHLCHRVSCVVCCSHNTVMMMEMQDTITKLQHELMETASKTADTPESQVTLDSVTRCVCVIRRQFRQSPR